MTINTRKGTNSCKPNFEKGFVNDPSGMLGQFPSPFRGRHA